MKKFITLLAAAFIFTASFATTAPAKLTINIPAEKAELKVSLLAAGKVAITWTAAAETTTTAYSIQKSVNGGEFKTVAYLMGETRASYTYKDKVSGESANITYRVVTTDNNTLINTVSQSLVIL